MTYSWRAGANGGGGYVNAGDVDPQNPGRLVALGDIFPSYRSDDAGLTWTGAIQGTTAIPYGKAAMFSKRPSTAGLCFVAVGNLHATVGTGWFGFLRPGAGMNKVDTTNGYGTNINIAHPTPTPRHVGTLIVSEYDSSVDKEYVYGFSVFGIVRYANNSAHEPYSGDNMSPVKIKSQTTTWKSACWLDSNHILASTYVYDTVGGAQTPGVYVVSSATSLRSVAGGAATVSAVSITGGPSSGVGVNAIKLVDGVVYAACDDAVYQVATPTSTTQTWTKLGSGFWDDTVIDVCGYGGVLYAAQADTTQALPAGHAVASSSDAGATWQWLTTGGNVSTNVYGTDTPWWLGASSGFQGLIGQQNSDVSQIVADSTGVYAFERNGVWKLSDGVWCPAVNGLNGTSAFRVSVDGSTVTCSDVDWTGEVSSDRMLTCTRLSSTPSFSGSAATTRTQTLLVDDTAHTFAIVDGGSGTGTMDVTMDDVSIADNVFRGWAVTGNIEDMAVSTDGYVYLASSGGGVLVGVAPPFTVIDLSLPTGYTPIILRGPTGDPNGLIEAVPGSIILVSDTEIWVKKTGNTEFGWQEVALTGVAQSEYTPMLIRAKDGSPNGTLAAAPGTVVVTAGTAYVKTLDTQRLGWRSVEEFSTTIPTEDQYTPIVLRGRAGNPNTTLSAALGTVVVHGDVDVYIKAVGSGKYGWVETR